MFIIVILMIYNMSMINIVYVFCNNFGLIKLYSLTNIFTVGYTDTYTWLLSF